MEFLYALLGLMVGVVAAGIGVFLYQEKRRTALLRQIDETSAKLTKLTEDVSQLNVKAQVAVSERDNAMTGRAESEAEVNTLKLEIDGFRRQVDRLKGDLHLLEQERKLVEQQREALESAKEEQKKLLEAAETQFKEAFQALSGEALKENNQAFLDLAKESLGKQQEEGKGDLEKRELAIKNLVGPIEEKLESLAKEAAEMEKKRAEAYGSINEVINTMTKRAEALQKETGNLVNALKTPVRRGQWGEVQLKNVVEMAGMIQHCDFEQQTSVNTDAGERLRPDMTVNMPGDRKIVVDSKVSLAAYLEAIEQDDDDLRKAGFVRHAAQVRTHVTALSSKDYQRQFEEAPDFVVMFLPGEPFYSAALEQDPSLIQYATDRNVIIATPTTLIALLRAIAYGWRQTNLEQDAKRIAALGQTLYERIATMGDHVARVGKNLDSAVESYNKFIGSLESRVLPSAREMKALPGFAAVAELRTLEPVEVRTRILQATEIPALPFED